MEIPKEVYEALRDFVIQRESDIHLEMENFDLLKPVLDWIKKV